MKRVRLILSALVVAGLVLAVAEYVDGEVVEALLLEADWWMVGLAVVATTGMKLTESLQFKLMSKRVANLSLLGAAKLYISGQPSTLLPGGVFFRAMLLQRQEGTSLAAAGPVIALQSALDIIIRVMAALVAAVYFQRQTVWVLVVAVVISIVSALMYVESVRKFVGSWLMKAAALRNVEDKMHEFLQSAVHLLSPSVMVEAIFLAALIFTLDILVLVLTAAAFGVGAGLLAAAMVLALPNVLGRLSGLPMGIGVIDASMVGLMDALIGVNIETAVVVVAVYRLLRYLLPVLAGAAVYFLIWLPAHGHDRGAHSPSST